MGYAAVLSALYEPDPSFVSYTPPRQRMTKAEECYRKSIDARQTALLNAGISPKTPVEEKPSYDWRTDKSLATHRLGVYDRLFCERQGQVHEWVFSDSGYAWVVYPFGCFLENSPFKPLDPLTDALLTSTGFW